LRGTVRRLDVHRRFGLKELRVAEVRKQQLLLEEAFDVLKDVVL